MASKRHWAMLKRGHDGVYHCFSVKHLNRYVKEFEGRHNSRPLDTEKHMASIAKRSANKRLPYAELVAESGCERFRVSVPHEENHLDG